LSQSSLKKLLTCEHCRHVHKSPDLWLHRYTTHTDLKNTLVRKAYIYIPRSPVSFLTQSSALKGTSFYMRCGTHLRHGLQHQTIGINHAIVGTRFPTPPCCSKLANDGVSLDALYLIESPTPHENKCNQSCTPMQPFHIIRSSRIRDGRGRHHFIILTLKNVVTAR
jgi:hypothetical protein